jgi:uncharacterized oligopeptide transporter (OPT) family protein
MNHDQDAAPGPDASRYRPKPAGWCELTPRAMLCGFFVAILMGASYPYVVLKLGFGPNVSVVAAILGYVVLGLLLTGLARLLGVGYAPYNRWENNIVQTAGTAAAQTAFMCILLAAFDMLAAKEHLGFHIVVTPIQSFAWLTTAGLLGVLLAVPLRRHYIVEEKLPFADGLAAGETILVCDSQGPTAARAALAMVVGLAVSALLMLLTEESHVGSLFSSTLLFGTPVMLTTRFGVEWSLLAVGSGMLVGLRINVSMLLGTVLSWVVAPYLLRDAGLIPVGFKKIDVLSWVMWPATGILVAGGLAALLLRWQVLVRTFKNLSTAAADADEFPLRWVALGALVSGGALVVVQNLMFGQPVWITLAAIVLSIPLALVGLRVLGETNWGPISSLSNVMQGIFGFLAPGNLAANMVASGTTGTIASESEAIMQDYKAGDMVGSSPRYLTYMQLLATPVGAAAVAWMYPVLRDQYGFGDTGLSSPTSVRWAAFAEVLSKGAEALPPGALAALIGGSLLGILLAVLESTVKNKTWIPSPAGLGIGMLIPATSVVTMVVGGLLGAVWNKASPRTSGLYQVPLASGLIAGEALVAVVVPVLVLLGLL